MTTELIILVKIFFTASVVFGPIICYAYWYNMKQEREVAALKHPICVPSRSQIMRQSEAKMSTPVTHSQEKWTIINPEQIEQHGKPHQLSEQFTATKMTHSLFKVGSRQDA